MIDLNEVLKGIDHACHQNEYSFADSKWHCRTCAKTSYLREDYTDACPTPDKSLKDHCARCAVERVLLVLQEKVAEAEIGWLHYGKTCAQPVGDRIKSWLEDLEIERPEGAAHA